MLLRITLEKLGAVNPDLLRVLLCSLTVCFLSLWQKGVTVTTPNMRKGGNEYKSVGVRGEQAGKN